MRGLADKVYIVTGGGRGIDAATAQRLSEEGAKVVVVDIDGDVARELADSLPGEALGLQSDVSVEADVRDHVGRTIAHFGRLDGAHLNAGIGGAWGVGLADTEMDDFDRVVAVNLRGVCPGLRETLRHFRRVGHGGAIVTTASTAGIIGGEWASPYVGAKHGVVGLTKTAAVNGGPLGVRVNCVAPGLVVTRLTDVNESVTSDAALARLRQIETVPLGRAGSPQDIAGVVACLLSDDAAYVSGVLIPVEGGSLADHPRARAIANLRRAEAADSSRRGLNGG